MSLGPRSIRSLPLGEKNPNHSSFFWHLVQRWREAGVEVELLKAQGSTSGKKQKNFLPARCRRHLCVVEVTEHWSWLHRSSWMLTGLLWAFWLFKVWFLWLASKHALDLDVNFISSLGEGSWIVQSVGCQLGVTTRDCWKEKFWKESAKWSLCFRESFKLGPFWIRWSSQMIMRYERCQDLFSSDLTPLKTRSHRPLRNEAHFYIGLTLFKTLRPSGPPK